MFYGIFWKIGELKKDLTIKGRIIWFNLDFEFLWKFEKFNFTTLQSLKAKFCHRIHCAFYTFIISYMICIILFLLTAMKNFGILF